MAILLHMILGWHKIVLTWHWNWWKGLLIDDLRSYSSMQLQVFAFLFFFEFSFFVRITSFPFLEQYRSTFSTLPRIPCWGMPVWVDPLRCSSPTHLQINITNMENVQWLKHTSNSLALIGFMQEVGLQCIGFKKHVRNSKFDKNTSDIQRVITTRSWHRKLVWWTLNQMK